MSIDVLIITSGRPAWLLRTVSSLRRAATRSRQDLNFLIGINGADAESARALRDIGIPFRELEKASPADARNRLLAHSVNAWVCFIDDDAYVPDDYFERFGRARSRFPGAIAIGGPNLTPPGASHFATAVGLALANRFATFTTSARYRSFGSDRPCDESSLILCNLFLHRSALLRERFPAGIVCAEENWLLARLKRGGGLLVHSPELIVYHERRATPRSLAGQVFKYGVGRGQAIISQPGATRIAHVLPAIGVAYSIAVLPVLACIAPSQALLYPFALYLLLGSACTGSRKGHRALLFALFALIHFFYGAGVLAGLALGGAAAEKRSPADLKDLMIGPDAN